MNTTRFLFLAASFFCGLSFAFMFPLMSLYLVDELGASPIQMGIFLAVQVTSGVLVATILGKRSDAGWSRKKILVASQIGFSLAMLVFIATRDYYIAMLASVLLLSVGSATLPQMFTLGRLFSEESLGKGGSLFMSLLRAMIAVAWVMGPPLAFLVKAEFGFSAAFAMAISCAVVMIAIVFFLPEYHAKKTEDHHSQPQFRWYQQSHIVAYLLACLFMFSACTMYVTSIPLFLSKELLVDTQWAGYLMGLAALLEIPFMVLAGIYGAKFGYRRLIMLALICGTAFFAGVYSATSVYVLMALQLLNGIFVAIIATLGMLLIQDMMKQELGLATTLFTSSQQVSSLLGSLLVGVVAQFASYQMVFAVAGIMVALSMVALIVAKPNTAEPVAVAA